MPSIIDEDINGNDNKTIKEDIEFSNIQPECKFWIGDKVHFTIDSKEKVIKKFDDNYWQRECNEYLENNNKSETFTINRKSKYEKEEKYPWWSELKDKNGRLLWIVDDGLILSTPSYKPKKFDRTLETIKPYEHTEMIKRKLSFSKYNPILVRIKTVQDRKKFFDIMKEYTMFPYYLRRSFGIGCDYIIHIKETSLSGEAFKINFTHDFTYWDEGDFLIEYPNSYPRVITPDEIDNVLYEILGITSAKYMYSPKRFDRTLESFNTHKYPYRFKTREEMIKQYGEHWKGSVGWRRSDNAMDYLLGTEININLDDKQVWWGFDLPNTNPEAENFSWIIRQSMLTKNEPPKPNYKPKRFDRTLESFLLEKDNTAQTAKEIYMVVYKKHELEQIRKIAIDLGYNWPNSINEDSIDFNVTNPYYIFFRLDNKFLSYSSKHGMLPHLDKLETDDLWDGLYTKEFTFKDIKHFENILKLGKIIPESPNYKPKRFNRYEEL